MKFIPVNKTRNLLFNDPVITKNDKGEIGLGKLMEKKHTADGVQHTFEMAHFTTHCDFENTETADPVPVLVRNITHVCIIKSKEQ